MQFEENEDLAINSESIVREIKNGEYIEYYLNSKIDPLKLVKEFKEAREFIDSLLIAELLSDV